MNLLEETLDTLKENGKKVEDISWIGSRDGKTIIEVDTFLLKASFEYDDDYGSQIIPQDLVIVGNNWWLDRREYDGSEWWAYNELPKLQEDVKVIYKINTGMWCNLGEE